MKKIINERNLYILVSIIIFIISGILFYNNYDQIAASFLGIYIISTSLFVYFMNNYRNPVKNEWKGNPSIEEIKCNCSKEETIKSLKKKILKSYIKVKEIQCEDFNLIKFVNKRGGGLSQFYSIFLITCNEVDVDMYKKIEHIINKTIYTKLSSYFVLLISEKNNFLFNKYLNEFPIYQPTKDPYFGDPPRTCLSVAGLSLDDAILYISLLPFKWYIGKTKKILKVLLDI